MTLAAKKRAGTKVPPQDVEILLRIMIGELQVLAYLTTRPRLGYSLLLVGWNRT